MQALVTLEQEGSAVRGHFDPDLVSKQWCKRRLLARTSHHTVERLHKEIAPVNPVAYMRFLFHWQGLADNRVEGIRGIGVMLDRLAGFSIPAPLGRLKSCPPASLLIPRICLMT